MFLFLCDVILKSEIQNTILLYLYVVLYCTSVA